MRAKVVVAGIGIVAVLLTAGALGAFVIGASANPPLLPLPNLGLQAGRAPARGAPAALSDAPVTVIPIPHVEPTETAEPAPPTAIPPAAPPAFLEAINGLPLEKIVVISDEVKQRVREIAAEGVAQGRNRRAFSKVGDSTMIYPPFMADFEEEELYNLGAYAFLQATIDQFDGSFDRESAAVRKGMHTWTQFDPDWADKTVCWPYEGPLACEMRLHNPSVALIRLGVNDESEPALFEEHLRKLVDFLISAGVVPILGSKPDRVEGTQNAVNQIIYRVAADYHIPLWDYALAATTVPGSGLDDDNVHMVMGETHDFSSPAAFQSGDPLQDLTALLALEAVHQAQ